MSETLARRARPFEANRFDLPSHRPRRPRRLGRAGVVVGLHLVAAAATPALASSSAGEAWSLAHGHADQLTLPAVLSAHDAARYRRAFAAQAKGQVWEADRLLEAVTDKGLVGVVLAERLRTQRSPKRAEVVQWLSQYADHAAAPAMLALARRLGAGPLPPVAPTVGIAGGAEEDGGWRDRPYRSSAPATPEALALAQSLERRVDAALKQRNPDAALDLLQALRNTQALDPVQVDGWRAAIAMHLFAHGRDREALLLAASAARSAQHVPQAPWVAGLAAWRLERRGEALRHFQAAYSSAAASAWTRAGAAYWAARSALAIRQPTVYLQWLERAADLTPTFYGLLARRQLGRDAGVDWSLPLIGVSELQALDQAPGFWRALALLQIDQRDLAEAEVRRAFPSAPAAVQPLALTIAERGGMPGLAMRLAQRVEHTHQRRYPAAAWPIPVWSPPAGYRLDPALVFAVMRKESQFEPSARSRAGAVGLMQVMPATARAMAETRLDPAQLADPARNLEIGERLLAYLLGLDRVKSNLFHMAVAYNGGAGLLGHVQSTVTHHDDPLLYLEAIPITETRLFVERMIANYWLYQLRLRLPTDSLDDVAAGGWPVYRGRSPVEVAQNPGSSAAQPPGRSAPDARN